MVLGMPDECKHHQVMMLTLISTRPETKINTLPHPTHRYTRTRILKTRVFFKPNPVGFLQGFLFQCAVLVAIHIKRMCKGKQLTVQLEPTLEKL